VKPLEIAVVGGSIAGRSAAIAKPDDLATA
jgi:hypothetical protein